MRVLDTREGAGLVGPGRTVAVDLASKVPTGTTAVVLNVTGVSPTAETYVTAYPSGEARPLASSLNLARGEIRANLVTVRVTDARAVTLYNHLGSTHLVADLAGYYSTGDGSRFSPVVYTLRDSLELGPRQTATLGFGHEVPESATAVVLNLTGVSPTAATFLTMWPTGAARPVASNVNLAAGAVNPNLVTVALGDDHIVSLYNNAGTITVHADLAGFYTPEYGAVFAPRSPVRVFDTRTGVGQQGGVVAPIRAGQSAPFVAGNHVPDEAVAAVLNLTGVAPTTGTFVSAWQGGAVPQHSNLNLAARQTAANLAVVRLERANPDPRAFFYNRNGSVNLVADLAGYFWTPTGGCVADCAYSWGQNVDGGLGTGTSVGHSFTPTQLADVSGVVQVADPYALLADGTVRAWGRNWSGELGIGVVGDFSAVPVRVLDLTGVVAVTSTMETGFALRSDGTVWGWGSAKGNLLGTDDYEPRPVPVQVPGLANITAIAGGHLTAYALDADGVVWAWGDNTNGEYGNGTDQPSARPVRVSGLTGVTSIGASMFTAFAVMGDGTVRAWGLNNGGQAGEGSDETVVPTPVEVPGATGVTRVVTDIYHVYALRTDGTVLGWGDNDRGVLGIGVDCPWGGDCVVRVPTPLPVTGVVDIAANSAGGYALDGTGTVWAWGGNTFGELGHGRLTEKAVSPVVVPNLPPVDALGFSRSGGRVLVGAP
ncbi:hypothetical protein BLA60_27185 [Actinophytocola xinjiangensis]|uniref:RCC1-like domain-containing protein n=1 Tax=Actinophytocola xinjiangensis TaxID=485602 RepID=A0A7Z0WL72_9PSEU|nr:hypothetical protein BLA60_27185 [Actinophytocola xinjiangensis]